MPNQINSKIPYLTDEDTEYNLKSLNALQNTLNFTQEFTFLLAHYYSVQIREKYRQILFGQGVKTFKLKPQTENLLTEVKNLLLASPSLKAIQILDFQEVREIETLLSIFNQTISSFMKLPCPIIFWLNLEEQSCVKKSAFNSYSGAKHYKFIQNIQFNYPAPCSQINDS